MANVSPFVFSSSVAPCPIHRNTCVKVSSRNTSSAWVRGRVSGRGYRWGMEGWMKKQRVGKRMEMRGRMREIGRRVEWDGAG